MTHDIDVSQSVNKSVAFQTLAAPQRLNCRRRASANRQLQKHKQPQGQLARAPKLSCLLFESPALLRFYCAELYMPPPHRSRRHSSPADRTGPVGLERGVRAFCDTTCQQTLDWGHPLIGDPDGCRATLEATSAWPHPWSLDGGEPSPAT